LYVGGSGPGNYTRIQDAIDNASDGDTVFVYDDSSPYLENVIINKAICLLGENRNTTEIEAYEYYNNTINVCADNVSINSFIIKAGFRGIAINSFHHIDIVSNKIIENGYGISVNFSSNITIMNNIFTLNECIISIYNSTDCKILYNDFTQNRNVKENKIELEKGNLYLRNSHKNRIQGNIFKGETSYDSITCWTCDENIISDNCFSEAAPIYIDLFLGSDRNIICNNSMISSYWNCLSIVLCFSDYNLIRNNYIARNLVGVSILFSSNNSIIGNTFDDNNFYDCSISSSDNNIFYYNNFNSNSVHVEGDEGQNTWNALYPSGGNYWKNYSGTDDFSGFYQNETGSDGIGDTPYLVPGADNKDMYPLMEPYGMTTLSLDLRGGLFKCSGVIKNIGNTTAFNVHWNIGIDGGFIFVGRNSLGILPKPLLPEEESHVSSQFILGFGSIILKIDVWADNAPYVSVSTTGKLLLFFIKI